MERCKYYLTTSPEHSKSSVDMALSVTTWNNKISARRPVLISSKNFSVAAPSSWNAILDGAKTVKIVAGSSVTVSNDRSSPVALRAAQSVEKSSSEHATPVIVHASYPSDASDAGDNGSDVWVG